MVEAALVPWTLGIAQLGQLPVLQLFNPWWGLLIPAAYLDRLKKKLSASHIKVPVHNSKDLEFPSNPAVPSPKPRGQLEDGTEQAT